MMGWLECYKSRDAESGTNGNGGRGRVFMMVIILAVWRLEGWKF